MWYNTVRENLGVLVRSLGVVRTEQLEEFFRTGAEPEEIRRMIRDLQDRHILLPGDGEGTVRYHTAVLPNPDTAANRVRCFWVPAFIHWERVEDVYPLRYPFHLGFITTDRKGCDIAWIPDTAAALACRRRILDSVPEGMEDGLSHLALLPFEERALGPELGRCGFTFWGVLDPATNCPRLWECERPE